MNSANRSRRHFFKRLGAVAAAGTLNSTTSIAQHSKLSSTAHCGDARTQRQTPGPFFTTNTPLKSDFRSDDPNGDPFTLVGYVKSRDCQPVQNAMVELWHADGKGVYDNEGYRMRGHQFTDKLGRFIFQTGVPGDYPGRTRHFHVTLIAAGYRSLTTQLYFPGFHNNARDFGYREDLELSIAEIDGTQTGRFDFVI
ncbi:MAG: intradiol ring-cleavage dioxygenase [Pseudomonadota bacterium]